MFREVDECRFSFRIGIKALKQSAGKQLGAEKIKTVAELVAESVNGDGFPQITDPQRHWQFENILYAQNALGIGSAFEKGSHLAHVARGLYASKRAGEQSYISGHAFFIDRFFTEHSLLLLIVQVHSNQGNIALKKQFVNDSDNFISVALFFNAG